MRLEEILGMLADRLGTAVVLTDASLDRPGPTILYANPAFLRMSGHGREAVLGSSPRLLQGDGTSALARRSIGQALRAGDAFHGCLLNYRASGEAYFCELDVRPVLSRSGAVEHFIAFEREVVRRRGRPGPGPGGRYRPVGAPVGADGDGWNVALEGLFAGTR